jgi:hypothetical protein
MQERIIQSLMEGTTPPCHAHRRREVALLPASGAGSRPHRAGGQPADRPHAGPGGAARRHGHPRRHAQQHAAGRGAARRDARRHPGRFPPALSFARTAGAGRHRGLARKGAARAVRHRRGALHFRMGPRIPPRVPPARHAAPELPRYPDRRLHRQRHPPRAARHSRTAPAARPAQIHRQLPPRQPALRGRRMRQERTPPAPAAGRARLRRAKHHRLRAHHRPGRRDWSISWATTIFPPSHTTARWKPPTGAAIRNAG